MRVKDPKGGCKSPCTNRKSQECRWEFAQELESMHKIGVKGPKSGDENPRESQGS